MTGRSAALQGGLAAVGPDRGVPDLAARAGARARRGRGHRRARRPTWRASATRTTDNILGLERRTEGGEAVALGAPRAEGPSKAAREAGAKPVAKPPAPAAQTPPRDVRGNADALKLADRFAPLVSPRAFGVAGRAPSSRAGARRAHAPPRGRRARGHAQVRRGHRPATPRTARPSCATRATAAST